MNNVASLEQKLRQVCAILAGNACDQCDPIHHATALGVKCTENITRPQQPREGWDPATADRNARSSFTSHPPAALSASITGLPALWRRLLCLDVGILGMSARHNTGARSGKLGRGPRQPTDMA